MSVVTAQRSYSRIAGHVVLDLVNTVSWRLNDAERTEDLTAFEDALGWAVQNELLTEPDRRTLRRQAEADPAAADRELDGLREIRETAYAALVERSELAADALVRRQRVALARTRLVEDQGRWRWAADPLTLAAVTDQVVREAISLLTSPSWSCSISARTSPAAGSIWTRRRGGTGAGASPRTVATATGPAGSTRERRPTPLP